MNRLPTTPAGVEIFSEQLPYCVGPYDYSFIEGRKTGKYRIQDRKDDPVGSAETEEGAQWLVALLNKE